MALSSKKNNNKEEAAAKYDIKVTRAKDFTGDDGKTVIAFDMIANGVTIYGCWYRVATNKKGEDFTMISFPSSKAKDGKYYSHAYFKITDEMIADIEKQIEGLL